MGQGSRKQTANDQIANLIQQKANKCARWKAFREWEAEDLLHELSGYWLDTRSQYTPARGDILTFADIVLNNYIRNLIAAQYAKKRDVRLCSVSLDECVEDEDGTPMSRHEIYDPDRYFRATGSAERGDATRDDLRIDLGRVFRLLTPKQRELCERLPFQEVTEIAKEMGVTRETVYQRQKRIRAIFEVAGLAVYLRPENPSDLDDPAEKDGATT